MHRNKGSYQVRSGCGTDSNQRFGAWRRGNQPCSGRIMGVSVIFTHSCAGSTPVPSTKCPYGPVAVTLRSQRRNAGSNPARDTMYLVSMACMTCDVIGGCANE